MGLYDMSAVPKVLNTRGIVGVDRIASMSFSTINKLTYKDTDDQSNKSLVKAHARKDATYHVLNHSYVYATQDAREVFNAQ
jgi:hypothetical protein